MEITVKKQTDKIQFYFNSKQIYPVSISGNQAYFSTGQIVLI